MVTRRTAWVMVVGLTVAFLPHSFRGEPAPEPGGPGSYETPVPPRPDETYAPSFIDILTRETQVAMQAAAAQQASTAATQDSIRRILTTIARRVGRQFTIPGEEIQEAGSIFQRPEILAEFYYGETTNTATDLAGYTTEADVGINTSVGKDWKMGLNISNSRTRFRGLLGTETEMSGVDAFVNCDVVDHLALGAFGLVGQVDTNEVPNASGTMYGGGPIVSTWYGFGEVDITLTTALAGTSQDAGRAEDDVLFTSLLDVQKRWTKTVNTSVYAFFSDSLRSGMPDDRTFWSVGAEVAVNPNDRLGLSLGCETTLGLKDIRDYRVKTGVIWSW